MFKSRERAAVGRTLVFITAAIFATACADRVVSPASSRLHARAAAHDDTPPDLPCHSGWLQYDGKWVCDGDTLQTH